jgi:uncharacterized protein YecT (DUF1311 family)
MIAALAASLLLAAAPAGQAYPRCLAAAEDDLRAQRDCIADEYMRQDALLNAAYARALARQPGPAARRRLRALERRWLADRDRTCAAAEAASLGLRNLELQQCLLEATRSRLETYRR